jgi:nucleoside-diphosphate-sugar epimerase
MSVPVIGGTGLIGSAITAHLVSRGDDVVVASRYPQKGPLRHVAVDLAQAGETFWHPHVYGVDAVINRGAAGCAGRLHARGASRGLVPRARFWARADIS